MGKQVGAGTGRTLWRLALLASAVAALAAPAVAALAAPELAPAALISVGGISVSELADALKASPVQQRGHPAPGLTAKQARALAARIRQRDPGRIWIGVVSPLSSQATGDLTRAVSDAINSDGVYIVVAGSSYHVTTTWESGEAARRRLAAAVVHPGDSLYVQLRRAVDSFAAADAAAGHPGSASTEQTGPGATTGTGSSSSHSSGSGGVIALIIAVVVVLVVLGAAYARRARGSLRAAHWRREQEADVRAQAQAAFVKLGEDIGALDIDSSMPNANSQGKDAYAKALDCYQDAEQRLGHADDEYQFAKAQEALRDGAAHIQQAQALFDASPPAVSAGVLDDISKLAALHEQGAITDAEFSAEKRRLLGE